MNEHEALPDYAACPRCAMEYHPDLPAMSRNSPRPSGAAAHSL